MPTSTPPFKRLLAGYAECPITGCWNWLGHTYPNGYGVIKVFRKMISVHRYSYELHKGEIPEGMQILHQCDNKLCVNPDHMRVGTHSENMAEAAERGRMRSGSNHPMFGKKPSFERYKDQCRPVIVKGKQYRSMKEAERELGLGSGTVRYWLLNKPHIAKAIGDNHA